MRARYGLLIVAGLFLVGFVANTVTGEAHPGDAAAQWIIIVLATSAFAFLRYEERLRDELLAFLAANQAAIRAGTAVYRNQPISYATRLRTCDVVLSFLLASFKIPIQRLVSDTGSDRGLRLGSGLVTFVFGWWGIPWGPIWTVKALAKNMRSSSDVSIGDVLEGRSTVTLPTATAR
jgi:hypothetical protein